MHHSIKNISTIKEQLSNLNSNTEIIAVSKTFNKIDIVPLIEFGHVHFGENKVQETQDKWPEIISEYKNLRLHMVGKLQTNKVKQAVKLFDYIHSVDSDKLAKKISIEQEKIDKYLKLFIQINIGNENQKSGIFEYDLIDFYEYLVNELKVDVIGLMCIPPIDSEPNQVFKKMNDLNIKIGLKNLSMGMSSDYLEAINHGSTFIRIGSKIFGNRS